MREIKFRAWSEINTPHMIPWEQLWNGAITDIRPSRKWRVMQYTGLKDKNGVEIYEGDILRQSTAWGSRNYVQVALSDECIHVVRNSIGVERFLAWALQDREMTYEVAGNIYENPELLEAK